MIVFFVCAEDACYMNILTKKILTAAPHPSILFLVQLYDFFSDANHEMDVEPHGLVYTGYAPRYTVTSGLLYFKSNFVVTLPIVIKTI